MKPPKTRTDANEKNMEMERRRRYLRDEADQWSFAHKETTAETAEKRTAGTAKNKYISQLIISFISIPFHRSVNKEEQSTEHHKNDTGNSAVFPRLPDYLKDAI